MLLLIKTEGHVTLCFHLFWVDLLYLFVSVHTLILFPGLGKDYCRAGAGNGERYDPEEDVVVVARFHALEGGDLPGLLLAADGAYAVSYTHLTLPTILRV